MIEEILIVLGIISAIIWLAHYAFEEAIAIEDQKKFKKNLEDYGKPRKKRQTNRRQLQNNIWIIDRIDSMFVVQFGELCGGGSVELVVWLKEVWPTLAGGSLEENINKLEIQL